VFDWVTSPWLGIGCRANPADCKTRERSSHGEVGPASVQRPRSAPSIS